MTFKIMSKQQYISKFTNKIEISRQTPARKVYKKVLCCNVKTV